jgi:hypothetical protein
MTMRAQVSAVLEPHPDTPLPAIESIETIVSWTPSRVLTVAYAVRGHVERLRMPEAQSSSRRSHELWRHTCFELFVGAQNDAEYYEFNFSPSGEWALYEFRDYRDGGPVGGDALEPQIAVVRDGGGLHLNAVVPLDRLPGIQPRIGLALGLAAVLESLNGELSYWALRHPPGKPDFHHLDNFALRIAPSVGDDSAIDYTGGQ